MLTNWDIPVGFRPFGRELESTMRNMLEDIPPIMSTAGETRNLMPIDILEKDNSFFIYCDLPGVPKNAIDVKVEAAHTLKISAEKPELYEVEKNDWRRRRERASGRIERSVRLPTNADVENATASNNDGVLVINVPKREQQPIKLTVQ